MPRTLWNDFQESDGNILATFPMIFAMSVKVSTFNSKSLTVKIHYTLNAYHSYFIHKKHLILWLNISVINNNRIVIHSHQPTTT